MAVLLLVMFAAPCARTLMAADGSRLRAQEAPEDTVRRFYEALGRMRWGRVATMMHDEALGEFSEIATMLVTHRHGDLVLRELYALPAIEEFEAWDDATRFVRTMRGMTEYARGLMESQVSTDVEILGTVVEGEDTRHVVYRATTDHMGSIMSEVSVTTLMRVGQDWRVLVNAELAVLKTALRSIPIGREAPNG